jgi:hypothetical protein
MTRDLRRREQGASSTNGLETPARPEFSTDSQLTGHSGEIEKNGQMEIEGVYFSGWRSKACLHPAQQK